MAFHYESYLNMARLQVEMWAFYIAMNKMMKRRLTHLDGFYPGINFKYIMSHEAYKFLLTTMR